LISTDPETNAMKMIKSPKFGQAVTNMASIFGTCLRTGKFDGSSMLQLGGTLVMSAAAFIGIANPPLGLVMMFAWGVFDALIAQEKPDVTNQIYEKIMKDVKVYVSKELMQQRLHDLKLEIQEMTRNILDVANARKPSYDHRLALWHDVLKSARTISNKIRESKYLAREDWCNTIAVILPMIELVEITSFVQYHWMVDDGEQDNEVPHAGDLLASISQKLLDRMVESENSYSNVWDEIVRNGIMWLYKDMDQTLGFKEWVHWWHGKGPKFEQKPKPLYNRKGL